MTKKLSAQAILLATSHLCYANSYNFIFVRPISSTNLPVETSIDQNAPKIEVLNNPPIVSPPSELLTSTSNIPLTEEKAIEALPDQQEVPVAEVLSEEDQAAQDAAVNVEVGNKL